MTTKVIKRSESETHIINAIAQKDLERVKGYKERLEFINFSRISEKLIKQ